MEFVGCRDEFDVNTGLCQMFQEPHLSLFPRRFRVSHRVAAAPNYVSHSPAELPRQRLHRHLVGLVLQDIVKQRSDHQVFVPAKLSDERADGHEMREVGNSVAFASLSPMSTKSQIQSRSEPVSEPHGKKV